MRSPFVRKLQHSPGTAEERGGIIA
jgi:hypothetical protein